MTPSFQAEIGACVLAPARSVGKAEMSWAASPKDGLPGEEKILDG